jgi:D-alanine-D-alanine ligase
VFAPAGGVYDYQAKYTPGLTEYFMPARLPPARYRGVLNLAERAAQALDTHGAVRVDLLVTEGQNEYVLEVNTLPGMTETSLLPKIAAAAGFDFDALCAAVLERAQLHTGVPRSARAELGSLLDLSAIVEEPALAAEPAVVSVPAKRERRAKSA